jgi:transposase InsO family protein
VISLQGNLSIERMCQLAGVSRAGFYRSLPQGSPEEEEMDVRSAIQQVVVEHRRRYGYRRVTAELRRRGLLVNHKRVARLMHLYPAESRVRLPGRHPGRVFAQSGGLGTGADAGHAST